MPRSADACTCCSPSWVSWAWRRLICGQSGQAETSRRSLVLPADSAACATTAGTASAAGASTAIMAFTTSATARNSKGRKALDDEVTTRKSSLAPTTSAKTPVGSNSQISARIVNVHLLSSASRKPQPPARGHGTRRKRATAPRVPRDAVPAIMPPPSPPPPPPREPARKKTTLPLSSNGGLGTPSAARAGGGCNGSGLVAKKRQRRREQRRQRRPVDLVPLRVHLDGLRVPSSVGDPAGGAPAVVARRAASKECKDGEARRPNRGGVGNKHPTTSLADLRSPAGARQQQQRSSAVSTGGSLGTSAKPVASVPPLQAAETPAGVVDMLPCDVSANRIATTAAMAATAATSTPSEDVAGAVAVALFDFEAQHSDELGFAAGERLAIDGRYDHEWLLGHSLAKSDSHQGIFPASFVQILGCFENGSEAESFKKEDDARSKIEDQLDCSNREENNQRASNTLTSNKEDQLRTPVSNSNNQEHSQSLGRPAVALYTFSVEEKGDLAFKEGETVWVLSRINKDWLRGRNARGEEGQFPASFVHPEGPHDKSDDCGNTRHSKAVESVQESSLGDAAAAISPNIFVCLYDFEAEQKDDLTIHVGDKIQVTEKVSEEWWQGRVLGAEREGIFPATFVKSMSLG